MTELKSLTMRYAAADNEGKAILENAIAACIKSTFKRVEFVSFNNLGWVAFDIGYSPILTAMNGVITLSVCCPREYRKEYEEVTK